MRPFEYHRPRSLEQALALMKHGVPLGGGRYLTPRMRDTRSVIDLQDLGLEGIEASHDFTDLGAATKLQALIEAGERLPAALREACWLEAPWNLRNMATLAGTVICGRGRSPLLTVLLALGAQVISQPGDLRLDIDEFLNLGRYPHRRLITRVRIPKTECLLYDQVARSPADRPLVAAAVAITPSGAGNAPIRISLGGFGERPLLLQAPGEKHALGDKMEEIAEAARRTYAQAEDFWASAEYRSHVAGILVQRMLREGLGE